MSNVYETGRNELAGLVRPEEDRTWKTAMWIYNHPTAVKVMKVASMVLGLGMLAALPFAAPFIGGGVIAAVAITGILVTLASAVANIGLDLLVPPHHDMKTHVFKPGKCDGGELYYDGDVPVLSITTSDLYKAGKAHGYLCGAAISKLSKRFAFGLNTLGREPTADQMPKAFFDALRAKIPQNYLKEMEGLHAGYNEWAKKHWWMMPKKLTLDDILLVHLMPDSCHFSPKAAAELVQKSERERAINEGAVKQPIPVACTSLVDENERGELVFARNMDWPSLGLAGAYSLVINRKQSDGLHSTVEVGMPGMIGTLTGMNDSGLSLAMNVCGGNTKSLRGMPACLFNRYVLENFGTVEDAGSYVEQGNLPLGPYHMTLADKTSAEAIHFYQSSRHKGAYRRKKDAENPLSTLNCRYEPEACGDMHESVNRSRNLAKFFAQKQKQPLEEALRLPYVNNILTTHTVVMNPSTGSFRVGFDNAFSANTPLHSVTTGF